MDRKSFFKRTLLGIGAAILPASMLKFEADQEIGGELAPLNPAIPFDPETTLFWQLQSLADLPRPVKVNKFYWAAYGGYGDDELTLVESHEISPVPITFRVQKRQNV